MLTFYLDEATGSDSSSDEEAKEAAGSCMCITDLAGFRLSVNGRGTAVL